MSPQEALRNIRRFVMCWTDCAYDGSGEVIDLTDLALAHDALEAARYVLACQSEPPDGYKFGAEQRVLLASDEVIRNSLPGDKILGTITDLEKLVFWTTHTNPEQGKAFRALLEGRVYVQEVTP